MFLTEIEVAERLRCSRAKVKRLRLSGRLAYIKVRPVLVSEEDLAEFIRSHQEVVTALPRVGDIPGTVVAPQTNGCEAAVARARLSFLKRRLRGKG